MGHPSTGARVTRLQRAGVLVWACGGKQGRGRDTETRSRPCGGWIQQACRVRRGADTCLFTGLFGAI
jgi:hypothetical protein